MHGDFSIMVNVAGPVDETEQFAGSTK